MGESPEEQERGLFYRRGAQKRGAEEQWAPKEVSHSPLPEERSLMDGEGNMNMSWDVGAKQHKGPVLDEHSSFLTDISCGLGVPQEALP